MEGQPSVTRSTEITRSSAEAVTLALRAMFGGKVSDARLRDYAQCVCLLSDAELAAQALHEVDAVVFRALNELLTPPAGGAPFATLDLACTALRTDALICAGHRYDVARGLPPAVPRVSVSKVLKRCVQLLGIRNIHTDMPCAVFSDAQSGAFLDMVKQGFMFVDGVTAGHGEFTHTIQWLMIAAAKNRNLIQVVADVGTLYREAVTFTTVGDMIFEAGGTRKQLPKSMWDVVVDCFLPTVDEKPLQLSVWNKRGQEQKQPVDTYAFDCSLFSPSFRCPRMLQYALFGTPGEAKFNRMDVQNFRLTAGVEFQAPLLQALLANRHRHKGLDVLEDTGATNRFQSFYSGRAATKEQEFRDGKWVQYKGAGMKQSDFHLETRDAGTDKARHSFLPFKKGGK